MNFKYLTWSAVLVITIMHSCTSFNPVDVNSPITLDCEYNSNTILTNHNPNGVDYIASCLVEISKGTLTIEPGTIIEFQEGTGLEVNFEGILKAEGISGDQIIFRGINSGTALWRGIFINASQGNNVFEHVEIADAGDGTSYSLFENVKAALTIAGRISMTNSIIKNSGDVGIFSTESLNNGTVSEFSNNQIIDCASYPIYLRMELAQNIDFQSCSFKENGNNVVAFHDLDGERLENDLSLKPLDVPYYIESELELYAGLTLEAGVDLQMGNNALINVSNIDQKAYLKVQGTQSNHVTIRGKEALSGFWRGIYIPQSNTQNIFEFLDISDGGANPMSFSSTKANIALEFDGSLSMINCTSARSGSNCDILVNNFGGSPDFVNMSDDLMVCVE